MNTPFDDARTRSAWTTSDWRHTLEEWPSMIADGGFVVHRVLEPRPTAAQVHARPELDDCSRLPSFPIFDLRMR